MMLETAARVRVATTKAEIRAWARACRGAGETVALVPTMGYLHAGHLSLVARARELADRVALSIFVNPLQFGPAEDLDRYPRDLERDLDLATTAGVDLVFTPSAAEMYPGGEPWTVVDPVRAADRLCGASRPGHFRGVLTVVAKLLLIAEPDVAVFGAKDFQQLTLIRRMVRDLDMPVRIEGAPIVRETDGLAMSSRNVYLSGEERERALCISRGLFACLALFRAGERRAAEFRALLERTLEGVALEYAEIVDPESLEPVFEVRAGTLCAVAARVGGTRLIDNVVLS